MGDDLVVTALSRIDEHLQKIDARTSTLESRVAALSERETAHTEALERQVDELRRHWTHVRQAHAELRSALEQHERRMEARRFQWATRLGPPLLTISIVGLAAWLWWVTVYLAKDGAPP